MYAISGVPSSSANRPFIYSSQCSFVNFSLLFFSFLSSAPRAISTLFSLPSPSRPKGVRGKEKKREGEKKQKLPLPYNIRAWVALKQKADG